MWQRAMQRIACMWQRGNAEDCMHVAEGQCRGLHACGRGAMQRIACMWQRGNAEDCMHVAEGQCRGLLWQRAMQRIACMWHGRGAMRGNAEDCMHVAEGQCRGLHACGRGAMQRIACMWQRGNAEDCCGRGQCRGLHACGRGAMQRIAVAEGNAEDCMHVAEGNAASRNGTHAQVAKNQAKV